MPPPRAAAGRLLPVERRLRVHHPAAARQHRPALPGQRGGAQDQDVRLDRRGPGGPLLLRGPEQDLDVPGPRAARPAGAPRVRRVDAAPLGTHVRGVARPAHAVLVAGQGRRRGATHPAAAHRRGARGRRAAGPGARPGLTRDSHCLPRGRFAGFGRLVLAAGTPQRRLGLRRAGGAPASTVRRSTRRLRRDTAGGLQRVSHYAGGCGPAGASPAPAAGPPPGRRPDPRRLSKAAMPRTPAGTRVITTGNSYLHENWYTSGTSTVNTAVPVNSRHASASWRVRAPMRRDTSSREPGRASSGPGV